jgi:hypothetical protein
MLRSPRSLQSQIVLQDETNRESRTAVSARLKPRPSCTPKKVAQPGEKCRLGELDDRCRC